MNGRQATRHEMPLSRSAGQTETGRGAAASSRKGRKDVRGPLSPARLVGSMLLVLLLVVFVTELLEVYVVPGLSEWTEGLLHVLFLSLTMAPVFYLLWYRPLTAQMRERRRSEDEVRRLSHQLLVAAEEERRRLALDLHDDFGQKLTSLQMRLEYLRRAGGAGPVADGETCRELIGMVRELGENLRFVVSELRPDILDDLGIVCAIEAHCTELARKVPDLSVDFSQRGMKSRLDPDVETVLYRICQELLNNVVKHARARRVQVRLTLSHPQVILSVQDDGSGFTDGGPQTATEGQGLKSGFGLISIRERAASVGGRVRIGSGPDQGTRVRVEVPVGPVRGAS